MTWLLYSLSHSLVPRPYNTSTGFTGLWRVFQRCHKRSGRAFGWAWATAGRRRSRPWLECHDDAFNWVSTA